MTYKTDIETISSDMQEDEDAVLKILDQCSEAIHVRDLDALGDCYAEDVRVFYLDSQPESFNALRSLWESAFLISPNPITVERKDIKSYASEGVAVVSSLSRLTGIGSQKISSKSWKRATVCIKKINDKWRIIHDHLSLPVDVSTEKFVYILGE